MTSYFQDGGNVRWPAKRVSTAPEFLNHSRPTFVLDVSLRELYSHSTTVTLYFVSRDSDHYHWLPDLQDKLTDLGCDSAYASCCRPYLIAPVVQLMLYIARN